jgi:hypothetical protein
VSVTVTNSSSLLRKFTAGRLTRSPVHFLHLVKHASSRRRSAAPFAGKRRVRNVAITPRGSCIASLGSFTPQPSRNGKLQDRVRVAAASAALAAAECLRHGQWNSLDKG